MENGDALSLIDCLGASREEVTVGTPSFLERDYRHVNLDVLPSSRECRGPARGSRAALAFLAQTQADNAAGVDLADAAMAAAVCARAPPYSAEELLPRIEEATASWLETNSQYAHLAGSERLRSRMNWWANVWAQYYSQNSPEEGLCDKP